MIELTFLKQLVLILRAWYLLLWYFLNKGFKFQTYVCNRCHDLLLMSMNVSNIAFSKIKKANCCCIISGINKGGATNPSKILVNLLEILI